MHFCRRDRPTSHASIDVDPMCSHTAQVQIEQTGGSINKKTKIKIPLCATEQCSHQQDVTAFGLSRRTMLMASLALQLQPHRLTPYIPLLSPDPPLTVQIHVWSVTTQSSHNKPQQS